MARGFRDHIDLNQNELRQAVAHVLGSDPGSPVAGQLWYHSGTGTLRFRTGSSTVILGRLDQITAPTGDVNFGAQKITNLTAGTAVDHGVNLGQLQDAIAGLNWKDSVRVATTANGTLSSGFESGDTVDGVMLATGDRILIKNQSSASENGIYTVAASGTPSRATDADTATDIRAATVYVEEGTTNAASVWTLATNPPITLGSTSLTFAQFAASSLYSAGAGLTLTGNQFDVGAGTGIVANANDVALDIPVTVDHGGTGATTASGARTNLGVPGKYAATIGDGSSTSIGVTHNLGTRDVVVSVHDAASFEEFECGVVKTNTNTVTLSFAVAPSSSSLRVTVIG